MTGRDRVLTALDHREPDRIPIDFWGVSATFDRLAEHWGLADREAVLDRVGVDLRYLTGPSADAASLVRHDDGTTEDHWGVRRREVQVAGTDRSGRPYHWSYQHVADPPLAHCRSVQDIERHPWPSADRWDYSGLRAQCETVRERGLAVVVGGHRLDRTAVLKPAMYLRGTEAFLSDLLADPPMAQCVIARITDYYLDYNRRMFESAEGLIDIFFMGDDMGMQDGPWVSVDLYREAFKPSFARFNELAHRYGARTMYHTCGAVGSLILEFIDAGLDVLQSLQPRAQGMDLARIKREYGRDLCFQGGMDIQQTLPHGTPDQVRCEVRDRARTLGPGGGYIFGTAHNVLPDVPIENVEALIEAYHAYGGYDGGVTISSGNRRDV